MGRVALAALLLAGGCGQDISGSERGQIEVSVQDTAVAGASHVYPVGGSWLTAGQELVRTVRIHNAGQATLTVARIALAYSPSAGATDGAQPAFRLGTVTHRGGTVSAPVELALEPSDGGSSEAIIAEVIYTRQADDLPREALLTVESDTHNEDRRTITISWTIEEGSAAVQISPAVLDFGEVQAGQTETRVINVLSTGETDLVVSRALFDASVGFELEVGGKSYPPGGLVTFDPPLLVGPGKKGELPVTLTPTAAVPAEGTLILYTNDATRPSGDTVALKGNTELPCLRVVPAPLNFGPILVGSKAIRSADLQNCGTKALQITSAALKEPGGDFLVSIEASDASPLVVPVNGTIPVEVSYTPDLVGADAAALVLVSNAFEPVHEVQILGTGTDTPCPNAVITVAEGEKSPPLELLHLSASGSTAQVGEIATWAWEVQQPDGAYQSVTPSGSSPEITFQPLLAGTHTFSLTVWDSQGNESCTTAEAVVHVVPEDHIHVEVVWDTPGDPDPLDTGAEAGVDLDLHFAHGKYAFGPDADGDGAPDPWFHVPFDCYWQNMTPNWGNIEPTFADNPSLLRDDADGGGPEIISLHNPEVDTSYRVGVYVWNDWSYGPSTATLRVHILGELVFEESLEGLGHRGMWEAATITWPGGAVTPVGPEGSPKVVTPYEHPDHPLAL